MHGPYMKEKENESVYEEVERWRMPGKSWGNGQSQVSLWCQREASCCPCFLGLLGLDWPMRGDVVAYKVVKS